MRRRLLATAPVTLGLAMLGGSAYVYLAVAARLLGPEQFAPLAVLWTLVFTAVSGLLGPIEQEVGRLVATRRAREEGTGTVIRQGVGFTALIILLAAGTAVLARDPLAQLLFRGRTTLVYVAAAAVACFAVVYLTRGVLAGHAQFTRYGTQLGIEGLIRGGGAVIALVAGLAWLDGLAWLLVLAPVVALLFTLPPRRLMSSGPPEQWLQLGSHLATLTAIALLQASMINSPPVLAEILGGDGAEAGIVLAALVVARIPLFVFGAVQAVVTPRLSAAAVHGGGAFATELRSLTRLVLALAAAGVAVFGLLGPEIVTLAFGSPYPAARWLTVMLALSGGGFMIALLLSQAVVVQGRHATALACWVPAAVAMAGTTAAVAELGVRVAVGSLAGSVVATACLAVALRRASVDRALVDERARP